MSTLTNFSRKGEQLFCHVFLPASYSGERKSLETSAREEIAGGWSATLPLPEYGRVARDRSGISHWPAESANNVAAIGGVSAPTPSWYTPKPMEFHRAARRKALSLRQTWWRL